MTAEELTKVAERLERQIAGANADGRLRLQPEFARVIDRLKAEGADVPRRMAALDAALAEEAIEARFDNLPL